MSRLISLVSLTMLIAGIAYAYYTGLFAQVFDPKIQLLVAEQNLVEDQPVRPANFRLVETSLANAKPGYIVYPAGVTKDAMQGEFADAVIKKRAKKGDVLTMSHMGEKNSAFVMRVINAIAQGEPLDRSNVIVVSAAGSTPDGAITFKDNVSAFQTYIDQQLLTASRDIAEGEVLRVDDVAGDTSSVWVMESRGEFQAGDLLSLDDIDISSRPTPDLPRGAIAFPSKQAGEIFIATSGGLTIAKGLSEGDVFVVNSVTKAGGTTLTDGQLPQTLNELLEYRTKFPNSAVFVDEQILVGSEPLEGDRLNLWVETGKTEGPYGVIKIRKVAGSTPTFRVTNIAQTEDGPKEESKYWANIGRSAHTAIDEARAEGRVAFMVSDSTSITDFLGNGAICRDDSCSVSRNASDDLSIVRLSFDGEGTLLAEEEKEAEDPLRLLDGVDSEIERRMNARGYKTFRDIAAWEDAAMKVIAFNLEISGNLAVYVRQQARNIIENPEKSRRDLGLTNGDLAE